MRQQMCMCAGTAPASMAEALETIAELAGFVADVDAAELPAPVLGDGLAEMERIDAVLAAARGVLLAAFDAKDGHLADGHRTLRAWLFHRVRVTRRQAGEHLAVRAVARDHEVLRAGLRARALSKSFALQLAGWTQDIPAEFRAEAEEILIAAARAGATLHALAAICAEIKYRTAPPDPDPSRDPGLDRGLSLDTTFEGAGVLRGDLTPECAALVTAVLDALSAPQPGGDLRTRPQRYHDALAEAMRRLLASDLLPARAGQPTKALVHIGFPDLLQMDQGSVLQDRWITEYRARWAAHRAAASAGPSDGGAWLEGDAARAAACDAMIIPVVVGDIDPGAVEQLIGLCVLYDRARSHADARSGADAHGNAGTSDAADAGGPASTDGAHAGGRAGTPDATDPGGCASGPDGTHANGSADTPEGTDAEQAGPGQDATGQAGPAGPGASIAGLAGQGAGMPAEVLAMLEHQILATVIQIVSGPSGVASFLRRHLLGKGLNG
ncbi:MAG TPA: DUF222 domain-containing protein, partial [Streptosporangiaceae bacterium]|nr:DUF222 domain-containing protein [Streptosporangiaceae bacterium]